MTAIPKLGGVSIGGSLAEVGSIVRPLDGRIDPTAPVRLDAGLCRVLLSAGIDPSRPGGRVTQSQMAQMLAGKSVAGRIHVKLLLERSGLFPTT